MRFNKEGVIEKIQRIGMILVQPGKIQDIENMRMLFTNMTDTRTM